MKALRDCALGTDFTAVLEVTELAGRAVAAGSVRIVQSLLISGISSRIRGGIPGWPRWAEDADAFPATIHGSSTAPIADQPAELDLAVKDVEFVRASSKLRLTKGARAAIKSIVLGVWPEAGMERRVLNARLPTQHFLMFCRLRFDVTMMLTFQSIFHWLQTFQRDSWIFL